jgi:hypothetical protein
MLPYSCSYLRNEPRQQYVCFIYLLSVCLACAHVRGATGATRGESRTAAGVRGAGGAGARTAAEALRAGVRGAGKAVGAARAGVSIGPE